MQGFCLNCMAECVAGMRFCTQCGFDHAGYTVEPHHLLPGTMLHGRYRIGRVLGEGGFGITYVGWDTILKMKVAIKEFYMTGYVSRMNTYSPTVQVSQGTHGGVFQKNRNRFLDEARVLAMFAEEEGIVGIRDFFEENNTAYIVMNFLNGITLKSYLKQKGRLSWEQTFAILRPILTSLSAVHAHGIIHRDISPDNIMLTGNGKVKLLDFGAAREYAAGENRSLSIILKPGYAPEEQYRSKGQQGPWTDVYALCATMYCCLTGHAPEESMERTYRDTLRPPHELCDCPPAVSRVLMKGLSVYGKDRYPTVAALLSALQGQTKGASGPRKSKTGAEGKPSPKKNRWMIPAAAVLALLLAAALLLPGLLSQKETGAGDLKEEPSISAGKTAESGKTEKPEEPEEAPEEPEEAPEAPKPEDSGATTAKPEEPKPDEDGGKTKEEPTGESAGITPEGEWMLLPGEDYYADITVGGYGTITILLEQEAAPITTENFVRLAKMGFYDNLTFHRIIEGFVMQGGDPAADGTGGSGTTIVGEFSANGYDNPLSHTRGAISMARSSDYNSASSQFFIVHEDAPHLDGQYAVFGYVVSGMELVDAICADAMPVDGNGTIPLAAQPMISSINIRIGDSGPAPQQTEKPVIPPEAEVLAGLDVETEVVSIREETVFYAEQANAGKLEAVTVRKGVIAHVDSYGQVWMLDVSDGTDGVPYDRTYYFDAKQLIFAFCYGADTHRCYFYEGQMFRWRHTPDSRNTQVYTDYDMTFSEAYNEKATEILTDVAFYAAELEAMGYYV